jgi:hypothetical protein
MHPKIDGSANIRQASAERDELGTNLLVPEI